MSETIFIFGDDFWNTLGVIRSLGEKGFLINFINLCCGKSWVKHSRYIENYWQVSTFDEGLKVILSKIDLNKKQILLSTSDQITKELDIRYNLLSKYFILSNCAQKEGEIARLMDKLVLQKFAEKVGLNCISTMRVKLNESFNIDNVKYPCITKPVNSTKGGKELIHICRTPSELKQVLNTIIQEGCSEIQIQDFIEKEKEVLLCGCATSNGEIVIPGMVIKDHQYPYPFGAAGIATYLPIPDYIDLIKIKDLIKEIKFTGLFSLEFAFKNGVAYFLEFNLRNDGHGYAPTACGINLPYIWVSCESRNDIVPYKRSVQDTKRYQIEIPDLLYNQMHDGNLMSWLKTFYTVDFHLYYNKKDKRPFICLILMLFMSRTKKNIHRLFRHTNA